MSYFQSTKITDSNGVAQGVLMEDNTLTSRSYYQAMGEGDVANHRSWSKIGFTPTMNTTESDVWGLGGVYVWPTTASQWDVISSSANDAGTSIKSGTSTGGSTTTLIDSGANFTGATAVAIGDCVVLDKSGTTPEWGYVSSVDSATQLTISGGFSLGGTGSGRAYNIVDTSAATGAQVVKINYLDGSYNEKNEIVILNGLSAVNTVNTDFFRVNSFRIIGAGSLKYTVGNVSLRIAGGANTYSYIQAKYTRARNSIYTVPVGKTVYVTQYSASYSTTGNANKEYARLYTRANIEPDTRFQTDGIFYAYTEVAMQNSTIVIPLEIPTKLPAKTDIKISGVATASGVASIVLRGWIE
jgi:hypothetical protein